MLQVLAKYLGQTPAQMKPGISYVDAGARLDQRDVQHQIDYYRSQGEMKGDLSAAVLIDKRYATVLPGRRITPQRDRLIFISESGNPDQRDVTWTPACAG